MADDLQKSIIKQIEYYFGDINLPRDRFLQEQIKEDDGWVSLEVMLKFKRLASLSDDPKIIAEALEKSENKMVCLNDEKTKIRRNPEKPLPENNAEYIKQSQARSAYVKGFPTDETLDNIIKFMETLGPIDSVIRRTTKDHKFKGSCFVVFKDLDSAKKFVELESVKYKDFELNKKMQNDYHADKKKEIEERKRIQKEKKEAIVKESAEKIEFPSGAILYFSGIPEGKDFTREELKEKLKEVSKMEVIYIDFNKGDLEGYARFGKENNAVDFFETLSEGEFELGDIKLKTRVLEGDEEKEYLKKTSEAMAKMRQKQKFSNRKRKGNFGGGGRHGKAAKRK